MLPRLILWASLIALFAPFDARALERQVGVAPPPRDGFSSAGTVTVAYYNLCSGAIWQWFNYPPNLTYGVFYEDPTPEDDVLVRTNIFYEGGAPAGYGFTSVALALAPFERRCPDLVRHGFQLFLPKDGWNTIVWNGDEGIPVEDCWVLVTHSSTPGDPTRIVTERGEGGGARPGGCGICFPPERPIHSWLFGAEPVIVCPGGPWFDDSACFLELVWTSEFRSVEPVSVESATWGQIKTLYR